MPVASTSGEDHRLQYGLRTFGAPTGAAQFLQTGPVAGTAYNGLKVTRGLLVERDGSLGQPHGKLFEACQWLVINKSFLSVINYSGSYQVSASNSDLAVYGWARNPLIEYYIVESYGAYNPSSAASRKGTVFCDGANYDILQTTRVNQPSIDGTQTFQQFWSVRNPKKNPNGAVNGTITVGCHFNAWKQYGMNLGSSHQYQIFVVEGSGGSGSATITIS